MFMVMFLSANQRHGEFSILADEYRIAGPITAVEPNSSITSGPVASNPRGKASRK
jgi:hypothetical protein